MWFSMRHQETESLWSQLDWCQLVCRIHSCWGDRLLQLQDSSKHPPAVAGVTLHELWYEFGDTVNGAKTKEGSNRRIQMESSETKSKAREAGVLQLPPFPRKITVLPLNLLLACVSPDILLLLFELKSLFSWLLTKAAERNKETNRSMQQFRFLHII